jgi:hypothetical protein
LEEARRASAVFEAKVLAHHAATREEPDVYIIVRVLRSFKGDVSGSVRLYGSGLGDCTSSATSYPVDDTLLFAPSGDGNSPNGPAFALHGVCGVVDGR